LAPISPQDETNFSVAGVNTITVSLALQIF
jgi:hypothetical protein